MLTKEIRERSWIVAFWNLIPMPYWKA
jgi:hypothetical protein